MIKKITFKNRFGESVACELADPAKTGFAITSITGLGPGASNINVKEIATSDGGYFGSARTPSRNIVFTFRMYEWCRVNRPVAPGVEVPDIKYYPPELARHKIYKLFKLKSMVEIAIETDYRTVEIYGYVESNEPVIFSDAEETQVSIICPGYYFKMLNAVGQDEFVDDIYSYGLFSFPFSNESLRNKLLMFGDSTDNNKYILTYNGDAETGFEMTLRFSGDVSSLSIALTPNPRTDPEIYEGDPPPLVPLEDIGYRYISLDIPKAQTVLGTPVFRSGDELVISSIRGSKKAKLYRGDETFNLLDCFTHLDWLQLYPGYNVFETFVDADSVHHVTVSIRYQALCEGI